MLLSACQKEPTLSKADQTMEQIPFTPPPFEYEVEGLLKERFFDDAYLLSRNPNLLLTEQTQATDREVDTTLHFLQYVIDYQDDQENFIQYLVDSVGYPLWSQREQLTNIILIPFAKEDSELTEGVLVVKLAAGNLDFKLLLRNRLYNNVIQENIHPNYRTELEVFEAFDYRLFGSVDLFLRRALGIHSTGQSDYRCPANYFWECTDWIRPLGENTNPTEANDRSNPCGALCTDCILFVYVPNDCLGNHYPAGWGNTNGNDVPPSAGGSSGYGGGSGNNGVPPDNPRHWWEEENYPGLLQQIIADLEIAQEDAFIADCLLQNFELQAQVGTLIANWNATDESLKTHVKNALVEACTCDEYDERGREQCDEAEAFENILPVFPICSESFNNFTPTGSGATINFECNRVNIFIVVIPETIENVCYQFPDMCISTGKFEIVPGGNEPLGSNTRKQLMAESYQEAAMAVNNLCVTKFENGLPYPTNLEAQSLFKEKLLEAMAARVTNPRANFSSCQGNAIGTGRPFLSYFGFCNPAPCDCQ